MSLTISTRHVDPDISVVEITGKMTFVRDVNVETVVDQLLAEGAKKIVFDLSALTYIDSSGIGQLVSSASKIGRTGRCCICGTQGLVHKVFEITRIFSLVPSAATLQEACALLSA